MKRTKDGRRAYGSPPVCECGNLATIKFASALVCERCYKVDRKNFTDKSYCGVLPVENGVQSSHGEAMQVHGWRPQTSNTHRSEFE